MASFVREVLSAAGTLGEKEDFAGKTTKIQKKVNDLKSQLVVEVENRYGNYSSTLASTTAISTQMERLAADIDNLDSNINKHFRTELTDRNKELVELNDSMTELNLTLQIVKKIKSCYDLMEESNEKLASGKWLAAASSLQTVLNLLRSPASNILMEDTIKILPAIKKEVVTQKNKLTLNLKEKWNNSVSVKIREDDKTRKQIFSLVLKSEQDRPFADTIGDLVEALAATESIENITHSFVQHLKNDFLTTIICRKVFVDTSSSMFTISVDKIDSRPSDPFQVLECLKVLFSFLATNFSVPAGENKGTFLQRIGGHLSSWFCQTVIQEVLAPAVPSSVDKLADYEKVLEETEMFHEFLTETGFLPSSNLSLVNYARNVDALFANKLCQELLVKARQLMKEDLFTTVIIESDNKASNGYILDQKPEDDDLPIPPNFKMPDKSFKFPRCSISTSTVKVLELAKEGLEEAAVAKPFCSVRLFNTVRNIFELWGAVVPTYHKTNLETLPQLSAIAHNSAMYLAHQLITLGFLYKDKLPAMSQHVPTFIDIVPRLRNVGGEMMLRSMRIQRDSILSTLGNAAMYNAGSERRLSSGVDQAFRQFIHLLNHLHKVWEPVLPLDIYHRCIGTLVNSGLEEIIQRILGLSDISAEMSEQYCSLLNQVVLKAPELFKPSSPDKFVKKWLKFQELILVLSSSLRVIEDRWGEGKGVLAKELSAEEIKQLIRAIFQNTERRAAVLSKIK